MGIMCGISFGMNCIKISQYKSYQQITRISIDRFSGPHRNVNSEAAEHVGAAESQGLKDP